MRFLLHISAIEYANKCLLPADYQYFQSAVIYKILYSSNDGYASWLHENGYEVSGGKRFKLFCYSDFRFSRFSLDRENRLFQLITPNTEWSIGFLPERSTREFIQGLFSNVYFTIGNKEHHIKFHVDGLELQPPLPMQDDVIYKARTPICVKEHSGKLIKYLAPTDDQYKEGVLKGLLSHYEAFHGKPYDGDISDLHFEVISVPKSSLIDIKGIKVRGFRYNFRLVAPWKLQQIAYDGGIGEQCSQGFGFIERREYK